MEREGAPSSGPRALSVLGAAKRTSNFSPDEASDGTRVRWRRPRSTSQETRWVAVLGWKKPLAPPFPAERLAGSTRAARACKGRPAPPGPTPAENGAVGGLNAGVLTSDAP